MKVFVNQLIVNFMLTKMLCMFVSMKLFSCQVKKSIKMLNSYFKIKVKLTWHYKTVIVKH